MHEDLHFLGPFLILKCPPCSKLEEENNKQKRYINIYLTLLLMILSGFILHVKMAA